MAREFFERRAPFALNMAMNGVSVLLGAGCAMCTVVEAYRTHTSHQWFDLLGLYAGTALLRRGGLLNQRAFYFGAVIGSSFAMGTLPDSYRRNTAAQSAQEPASQTITFGN